MKRLLVVALGALALSAQAASYVRNTNHYGDPRYFATGCKYESVLQGGKVSAGIWVKNITAASSMTELFGNLHVNAYYQGGGLMLGIELANKGSGKENPEDPTSGYFTFTLEGKTSDDQWVRKTLSAPNSNPLLTDGKWHFVAGTYDLSEQTARFYLDGTLVAENTALGIATIPSGRCFGASCVGKEVESTDRQKEDYGAGFTGLFAEVTLWDKALTADEVASLATRRALMWESGLVGYWPLADSDANFAATPATRADGSVPNAMFYYPISTWDEDFFNACPSKGRFVISPETAAERGYTVPEGCDYSSLAKPATNIQDAVDAATSGETVYVFTGRYPLTSEILLTGKSVSLKGLNLYTFEPDRDGVVVDGQGQCRTLKISRSEFNYRNVVDSLTLSNGNACVQMYNSDLCWGHTVHTMELLNCRIVGNRVTSGSSGVYVGKQGLVSNCVFKANHSEDNGVFGWTTDYGETAGFVRSRINMIMDCLVEDNTVAKNFILGTGANCIKFQGCTFRNNNYTCADNVSKPLLQLNGDGSFRDCLFENNGVMNGMPVSFVRLYGGSSMVSNCVFRGNRASSYGLAALENQKNVHVWDTVVSNCNDISLLIGGMHAHNVLMVSNGKGIGYRMHSNGVTSVVENCTIVNAKPAFYVSAADLSSKITVVNTIMAGSDGVDMYSNVTIPEGGLCVTNCCIPSIGKNIPTDYLCNIWTRAPGFKDAANGDYSLKERCFARDKGIRLDWMKPGKTDLGGNPRLVSREGIADAPDARPDLGCFEALGALPGMLLFVR